MSGKSCGSGVGSVRSCAAGGHEVVLDALYARKRDNKSVRVLTVIVYVFCVSLAAIMLSLYYVFFWEPKDAQYAQRKVSHTVPRQTSTTPMPTCLLPDTGRSNTSVNENVTYSLPSNLLEQSINTTDDTGLDFEFPANLTNNSIQQIKPLNLTSNDSGTNETDINT
ncbi:PREDICTED: uncharacterized protein LOC106120191 isoform X2 [Papilio xuthus]|uniref:Uncharacterized protein LOC106120191 isoform X2 n=1 Tax=Papilio xuthus TaxID=66420 RepID=A0AAJ7EBR2_PAPXU|nr:PREDICTED: uncharacterized protein LOC106120191 isoform X2 [Papilio xuthus]